MSRRWLPAPRAPDVTCASTRAGHICSGCRDVAAAVAGHGDRPRRRAREGEPRRLRPRLRRDRLGGARLRPARPRRRRATRCARGARRRRPDGAPAGGARRRRPERVCVRGSSMGGFIAIHAAATSDAIAGAIAICPAGEEHLLRGPARRRPRDARGERARADLEAWLGEHDLREAVELMGAKPLILIHAARRRADPERLVRGALRARGRAAQADRAAGRPPPLRSSTTRASGRRAALDRPSAGLSGSRR